MVDDYGYLNARVRARFPLLLKPEDYNRLVDAESLSQLLSLLKETPYGAFVSGGDQGADAFLAAARKRLEKSISEILSFCEGEPAHLLGIIASRWDIYNLLTILRGKMKGVPAGEIARDLIPAGLLNSARLKELLGETAPSDVLDRIASWGLSLPVAVSRTLTKYIRSNDLASAEAYLEEGYFQWAYAQLNPRKQNHRTVKEFIDRMVDTRNIVGALIYLKNGIKPLGKVKFLTGGKLSRSKLKALEASETYEQGVDVVRSTPYKKAFPRSDTPLTEAERRMEAEAVRLALKQRVRGDQLGIGPALAFVVAQEIEAQNLRTIALGIAYAADRKEIKRALVMV